MLRRRATYSCATVVASLFLISACDGDNPETLGATDPVGDAGISSQTNGNISNPTLTTFDNFEVSPGDTLTLVWSDEFDGSSLDPATWLYNIGDGSDFVGDGGINGLPPGWGNNELQYYLPDNASVSGGILSIEVKQETAANLNYTSARISTRDRFAFRYGRIEASIKLPAGQGLWPAFWMLSQGSPYGSWAATGEIDIIEAVNLGGVANNSNGTGGGNDIFGTIYFGGEFPAQQNVGEVYTPSVDVTDSFNTYAVEWDAGEIRWYFNNVLYAVQNSWSSDGGAFPAPFDQPFYILLNVAVGGDFPGNGIDNSALPATMEVDYVRVYSGEE